MNSGVKNKIISILIAITVIVGNFVFVSSARAAVSANTIISMTNSARVQVGLNPYSTNSVLNRSAYAKAQDIIKNDYFAHHSPSGKSPWSFIKGAGYSYMFAGENLAINFDSAQSTHNAWMASPTHKSNILDKDFTEIGVAVLVGEYRGKQTTVIVQHFGSPVKKAITQNQKSSNLEISDVQNITLKKVITNNKKNLKIDLNFGIPNSPSLTRSSAFWFSSPALFVLKTIS